MTVTTATVPAARKRLAPWWCQILQTLCRRRCDCCCCSESGRLTKASITAVLGTVQILVGLFNIGLGPGRTSTSPGDVTSLGAAYWLGAVFIVSGIMTILAGQFPSSGLVGFTVFMNIAAAIFAITGVVLYAIDLTNTSLLWMCERSKNGGKNCTNVALSAQRLLTSMDVTLVAMAILQLVANIRFAVLGIKSLISEATKDEDGSHS